MENSVYHRIAEGCDLAQLPVLWRSVDLEAFSEGKKLYPYQREALENALKLLYQFYRPAADSSTESRKQRFMQLAAHNGLSAEQAQDFAAKPEDEAYNILTEYFDEVGDRIPAWHFVNRTSFWMATGSGKSIVLVKLMELLQELIRNGVIPQGDILFLTHRPDLIEQLRVQITEFNRYAKRERSLTFVVRDLKEFPEQKRQGNLFAGTESSVYYYMSHNFTEEQKESEINFRNYDNGGKWYIILDEAHKGDSKKSKAKQYFTILSRNRFLFNFSATFTEKIDTLTTVYNLNLAEYIKKGFGKHLYLFGQQFKNFKKTVDEKDFEAEEKQKIVLMSVIMLAFVKQRAARLREHVTAYHNPMLLTLVNSVSAEDSDLYLFFNELRKIAANQVSEILFGEAKRLLQDELFGNQRVEFEGAEVLSNAEINAIKAITLEEVRQYVFNTQSSGALEVRRNPKNPQELSFRVKAGAHSEPFALIKIGDVKAFEKNNLSGYDIEEDFEHGSLFENLDQSSVNILMGSRAFYEGWDSNRPNIINFVNIGTQAEAKKFILQSIGRGIRIEPVRNNRKRLLPMINDGVPLAEALAGKAGDVKPLETLFVFGTNQKAILSVLDNLRGEQPEAEYQLDLFDKAAHTRRLYIPRYKTAPENNQRRLKKLKIHEEDYAVFDDLMRTMDRTALAMHFRLGYEEVALLRAKHGEGNNFKKTQEEKIGKAEPLVRHIVNYYKIIPEEVDSFSVVGEEIMHYRHVTVRASTIGSATAIEFARLDELRKQIGRAKHPVDAVGKEAELDELLDRGEITRQQYKEEIKKLAGYSATGVETFSHRNEEIEIKQFLNHYYFPVIVARQDRIRWLKHVIDTPSEIQFLQALEKQLKGPENPFSGFDWWMFSKIDHTLDKHIRIPYIDPTAGKRDFLPDFIFWLQKNDTQHILYVDPKGTGRNEYQYKVDGYRDLFEEDRAVKTFWLEGKKIKVHLKLVTEDTAVFAENDFYRKYWIEPDNLIINEV